MAGDLNALIEKATDATLTEENWQYIFDVCDTISKRPEINTSEAIRCIKTRLQSRDANVLLRLLSLLVAMAENCGSRMKQEIASSSFLEGSIIKKFLDKKIHRQVKVRMTEVVEQLRISFKDDPSLLPIEDAYRIIKLNFGQYVKLPPNKPAKEQKTSMNSSKEELELERALKMSAEEFEREQALKRSHIENKPLPAIHNDGSGEKDDKSLQQQAHPDNSKIKRVRALYDLISYEPDELSFRKGDTIRVIEPVYRDWWKGMLANGKLGIFPLNYVTPVSSTDLKISAQEIALEKRLLEIDSRKVNRLLGLLSQDSSNIDEEELSELYNEVIPLKSGLARSIEKYGSKKDNLSTIHTELGNAFVFYNLLIDKIIQPDEYSAVKSSTNDFVGEWNYPNNKLEPQATSFGFGNSTNGNRFSQ